MAYRNGIRYSSASAPKVLVSRLAQDDQMGSSKDEVSLIDPARLEP